MLQPESAGRSFGDGPGISTVLNRRTRGLPRPRWPSGGEGTPRASGTVGPASGRGPRHPTPHRQVFPVARLWLGHSCMHRLARDIRSALRQLTSAPGVSGAVILALALGIGANAALFAIVEALEL